MTYSLYGTTMSETYVYLTQIRNGSFYDALGNFITFPKGETGSAGLNGATGPAGLNGATGPAGLNGATGPAGLNGATGPAGLNGAAATIQVGTVSVSGSIPTVTNVGTSQSAIFDFTFPASGSGGSSATGSINSIQYNNSGVLGGAENVFIVNGNINITSATATPATQSDSISLYNSGTTQSIDSRLSSTDQWGRTTQYATYPGTKIISRLTPCSSLATSGSGQWNSANIGAFGTAPTFPTRGYDATNLAPNFVRIRCAATTAANNGSGIRWAALLRQGLQWEPSNSGCFFQFTFATPTWNSGQRFFIGYQPAQGATPIGATTRIDSLLDMVGLGKDSDDTNLQFMINKTGAGNTATRADTGITPNVNNVYRFSLFINLDCSIARFTLEEITRTSSNIVATNTFVRGVDNFPDYGQQSFPCVYVNSVSTLTGVTVDIINGYEETISL